MTTRILFIRLSAIGDVLLTLPAVQRLRAAHPDWWIAYASEPPAVPLLRAQPFIDEVVSLPFPRWKERPLSFRTLRQIHQRVQRLRGRYHWAIVAHELFKAALVGAIAAPRRIGFARYRAGQEWLLTHGVRVPRHDERHYVERFGSLVAPLCGEVEPGAPERPLLSIPERTRRQARRHLADGPTVVLCPWSSQSRKGFPMELWLPLLQALGEAGLEVLIDAPPGSGAAHARRLAQLSGVGRPTPDLTLLQLAGLIAEAEAFLGVDSAPMHLAGLLGTPGLALWNPRSPYPADLFGPIPGSPLEVLQVTGLVTPHRISTALLDRATAVR